jgi:hypothetical protein
MLSSPPQNESSRLPKRRRAKSKLPLTMAICISLYIAFWLATTHIYFQTEKRRATPQGNHPFLSKSRKRSEKKVAHVAASNESALLAASEMVEQNAIFTTKNDPLSPQHFLSYQLHNEKPYNVTYGVFTQCKVGVVTNKWGRKPIKRVPLAPDFARILNVTTWFETNLKILMLGDSVGMQFHQILEEAAGASPLHRKLFKFAWPGHESVSISAPIRGGGVLAGFRTTGMFLRNHRGLPPPNVRDS